MKTWKETKEAFELNPATADEELIEFVRRASGPVRHQARIEATLEALEALGEAPTSEKIFEILLDLNGIGGMLDTGIYGKTTRRHWASELGTGRKLANDGDAWMSALRGALIQLTGEKDVEVSPLPNNGNFLLKWGNREATIPYDPTDKWHVSLARFGVLSLFQPEYQLQEFSLKRDAKGWINLLKVCPELSEKCHDFVNMLYKKKAPHGLIYYIKKRNLSREEFWTLSTILDSASHRDWFNWLVRADDSFGDLNQQAKDAVNRVLEVEHDEYVINVFPRGNVDKYISETFVPYKQFCEELRKNNCSKKLIKYVQANLLDLKKFWERTVNAEYLKEYLRKMSRIDEKDLVNLSVDQIKYKYTPKMLKDEDYLIRAKEFSKYLRQIGACRSALDHIEGNNLDRETFWQLTDRADWMRWLLDIELGRSDLSLKKINEIRARIRRATCKEMFSLFPNSTIDSYTDPDNA